MGSRRWTLLAASALACVSVLGAQTDAAAQGRGRGGGGGGGGGGVVGRGPGGGEPMGVGVDRGIGSSSDLSVRRSDAGLERARMREHNARRADRELREHPEMAARLHTNANELREGYRAALAANPGLEFGQYVAATRLAGNLGDRYPNVTREAILAGLAGGDGLGRTLRNLGVRPDEAKEAERKVKDEIKRSKRRS